MTSCRLPAGSRPEPSISRTSASVEVARRRRRLGDARHAGEEGRRELLEQAPDREVERVDVDGDAAARHQDVRRRELPLLAEHDRRPFVQDVARRQLVAAHRRVCVQRAGAAFDVDPAVAARRAGVARDRVELFLAFAEVGGERLQARRALLEVEREQRRAAGAARERERLAEIDLVGVRVVDRSRRRSRSRARRPRACRPSGRRSGFAGQASSSSRLVVPRAVLDLDHHARALVEAEVVGRRHVEDAVRALDLTRGLEGIAQRGAKLGAARLGRLQRLRGGDRHQPPRVPGVRAEGRHRPLAVGGLVLVDVLERAHPDRIARRQLRRDEHRARRQVRAVDVLAADAQEVVVGDAVRLVVLAGVAALLERPLRQHGRRSRRRDQDRVGLGGDELQHLPGHRRVGARVALVGDDRQALDRRDLRELAIPAFAVGVGKADEADRLDARRGHVRGDRERHHDVVLRRLEDPPALRRRPARRSPPTPPSRSSASATRRRRRSSPASSASSSSRAGRRPCSR